MKKEEGQEPVSYRVVKQMFCSICEHRTCDSCFVPEFTGFLYKMDDYETCILCKGLSPYRLREPIHSRLYYVEGSGQMCEHCFKQVTGN